MRANNKIETVIYRCGSVSVCKAKRYWFHDSNWWLRVPHPPPTSTPPAAVVVSIDFVKMVK